MMEAYEVLIFLSRRPILSGRALLLYPRYTRFELTQVFLSPGVLILCALMSESNALIPIVLVYFILDCFLSDFFHATDCCVWDFCVGLFVCVPYFLSNNKKVTDCFCASDVLICCRDARVLVLRFLLLSSPTEEQGECTNSYNSNHSHPRCGKLQNLSHFLKHECAKMIWISLSVIWATPILFKQLVKSYRFLNFILLPFLFFLVNQLVD